MRIGIIDEVALRSYRAIHNRALHLAAILLCFKTAWGTG